jgi:hypothetical protein
MLGGVFARNPTPGRYLTAIIALEGSASGVEQTKVIALMSLSAIVAGALATLLLCVAQAQQASASIAAEDRSFYLGRQVMHPESLSGIWETSNGHGGAIGIHLELDTTMPSDGDKQSWAPQLWQNLQVGVFERKGAEIQMGEENGFSDSRRGGGVTFDQERLQLHFDSPWTDLPSVDLDLAQQPGGCWNGRLHRGDFDSHVTLCRPSIGQSGKTSPLVGTWAEISNLGQACIHIAEQAPGEFTGWSDDIERPGTVVTCINNVSKPVSVFQRFGERLNAHRGSDGSVSFELYAYTGMCCPHTFVGKLAEGGDFIQGAWPSGANQAAHNATWKKMSGDSCVSSDSQQDAEIRVK